LREARLSSTVLFGLVLIVAGCTPQTAAPPSSASGAGPAPAAAPLKIGVMAGFTGAIPVQSANTRFASQVAVDVINAKGGVQVGSQIYKVELATEDDKCDPAEGQLAMDRLISVDKVNFLVGGQCSAAI